MSNEKQQGRFEKTDDQALRNYEAAWKQVRKDEEAFAFQRRKRRILAVTGLILTTAGMIALVTFDQMTYITGMAFNALFAALFGAWMK